MISEAFTGISKNCKSLKIVIKKHHKFYLTEYKPPQVQYMNFCWEVQLDVSWSGPQSMGNL